MESINQTPIGTFTAPVAQSARLISLDVIRGFALLGILIMNIQAFSMIFSAYEHPYAYGDMTGLNYWVRWFSEIIADQKFMTIFSMLFGASVMLMAEKSLQKGVSPKGLHYRRMFWLALIGAIHAFLIWAGDILLFYAICGCFAILFCQWKARNLIIVGVLLVSLFAASMVLIGVSVEHMTQEEVTQIKDFWNPPEEQIAEQLAGNRAGWLGQWDTRIALYSGVASGLPFLILRLLGLMLIGMGLYKANLLDASKDKRFYFINAAVAIVIGYALTIYGVKQIEASGFEVFYSMFLGSQYGFFASIIIAWGYVCLIQLLLTNSNDGLVSKWFAPVGQMALSNYIFQSLVCGTIFFGWGFGLFGSVERVGQLGIVVAVWIAQIAISRWWLARYRFGPLEWLWRSLTYMQKQPMVKA